MSESGIPLGELVRSRAGRDSDRWFVVVQLHDDRYVGLADGETRRVCRPKKKNVRHLERSGIIVEQVARDIADGLVVTDSALKSLIEQWAPGRGEAPGGREEVDTVDG